MKFWIRLRVSSMFPSLINIYCHSILAHFVKWLLFLFLYFLSLLFWHFELFGWLIFSPQSFIYTFVFDVCCCSKLNILFISNLEKHTINGNIETTNTKYSHTEHVEHWTSNPKKNGYNYVKIVWRPSKWLRIKL